VAFTVRQPERPRKRTLINAELKAIWKATDGDSDYARIVRLCLLTGCRREEIGGLRTDETDTEFVFGRRGTGFSGWSKAKAALDTKIAEEGAALPAWSLHDLRRTFSTRLHDGGVEPLVVEALLAHKQQGVAAVYNRASFWRAKCAALELWHSLVSNIVK
jgi:integrase